MGYKKYIISLLGLIVLFLGACATEKVHEEAEDEYTDNYEPQGMQGEYSWLNEVGDRLHAMAATSSRSLASSPENEILFKHQVWIFSYHTGKNQFILQKAGQSHPLHWVSEPKANAYSFITDEIVGHPIAFSVAKMQDRAPASIGSCQVTFSDWVEKKHDYRIESVKINGKECQHMLEKFGSVIL